MLDLSLQNLAAIAYGESIRSNTGSQDSEV